jgi:hypothetical protein
LNLNLIGKILVVVPQVALFFHFMGDFFAIDSCLDSGRAYDYKAGECGNEEHYETILYGVRFWWLLFVSGATTLVGIILLKNLKGGAKKQRELGDR